MSGKRMASGPHKSGVQPIRRGVADLGEQREARHHEAGHQNDEYGRPVAGIGEAIVEAADIAFGRERQIAGIELAAVAGRDSVRRCPVHSVEPKDGTRCSAVLLWAMASFLKTKGAASRTAPADRRERR